MGCKVSVNRAAKGVGCYAVESPPFNTDGLPQAVTENTITAATKIGHKFQTPTERRKLWTPGETFRIVCFSARPYDIGSFEKAIARDQAALPYEFDFQESPLDELNVRLCDDAHAVCVFVNDEVTQPVLDYLTNCTPVRLVLLRCAGFNNVDLDHATAKGITVARVPEYSPYAVAEHAIALLMTLNRKVHKAYTRVREGNMSLTGLTGFDMYGKTVGIIGTGKIGECAINIFHGFGCKVIAHSRSVQQKLVDKGVTYVDLPTLYAQHMINEDAIGQMRTGVVIINTSRGGLLDTQAALRALKSKKIGGLGLDVYEREGGLFFMDHAGEVLDDDVFINLVNNPKVVLSCHQAFLTDEALGNIADTTIFNLREYMTGTVCLKNEIKGDLLKLDSQPNARRRPSTIKRKSILASRAALVADEPSSAPMASANKSKHRGHESPGDWTPAFTAVME